jgi:translation initiation factor 1 (eIF-1/SUI1)
MTDQNIINLRSADPFADVTGSSATDSGATGGAGGQRSSNLIHIRIQQRSGKKTLTTVQVLFISN